MKSETTLKKLSLNFIFSTFFTLVLSFILSGIEPIGWNFYLSLVIFLFIFSLSAFYGDKSNEANITNNWPPTALKIKKVIGYIVYTILIMAGFMFILGIVLMVFSY